ncbi:MAG: flagellar biosynthetic protein FliO [Burkholderiales bacterium]|nr:flagellar biosynthetic protein FliO [Burkholderiales bacterium]
MSQSLLPSLLVFLAVLAAIPLAAWLLKRSHAIRLGAGGPLAVVSAVAVGARERIALVRADDKWLVVGITGQSINLLTQLDHAPSAEALTSSADASGARFADLLKGFSRHDRNPR